MIKNLFLTNLLLSLAVFRYSIFMPVFLSLCIVNNDYKHLRIHKLKKLVWRCSNVGRNMLKTVKYVVKNKFFIYLPRPTHLKQNRILGENLWKSRESFSCNVKEEMVATFQQLVSHLNISPFDMLKQVTHNWAIDFENFG